MNLALPDHHEYFEPTNPRFFNDEIRIQFQLQHALTTRTCETCDAGPC